MIGQKQLIQKIDSLDLLPHSILITGERGSEQDEVCAYIAQKFDLSLFYMTKAAISQEFIAQMYESHTRILYVVDLAQISEREQNILLKVFEEPSDYIYMVLWAESDSSALETIKSRSIMFTADQYSEDDLAPLIIDQDPQLVLSVCSTPGQIEIANRTDMKGLSDLCTRIYDSMKVANFANALSIANKINFSDSYEKFDLYLFFKMMRKTILERGDYAGFYELLRKSCETIFSMNDKRQAFENFIIRLWISQNKKSPGSV